MRYLLRPSLLALAVASVALAQRPENASICDYYAVKTYGSNSSDTQFRLMQHIVALAFGGGSGLTGASDESTGILNHGFFDGKVVYLRPWFDGSSMSLALISLDRHMLVA
jgi:hypothetical protein